MDNNKSKPDTNALIHESSPYLISHAHNPVYWFPWGEETLQKAEKENKPLLISIGYAACHWCHVMEKESYSDNEVAEYMNAHFVAIKVDREERPDVDQVYMNASMLFNGSGGWPLNAIALPDGRPFYVVTYLPKENWLGLLQQIVKVYREQNREVQEQAKVLTEGIVNSDLIKPAEKEVHIDLKKRYPTLFDKVAGTIDFKKGGFNRAPKFPMPATWEWGLQDFYLTGNEKALKAATTTLTNMAYGGIYDQIGGGFARYATDTAWKVPHFEKMLYDNGQLISLYAHAFQLTKDPLYAKVIKQTLAFVQRELTDESGGFYASLNADSEGEEGKFYVWKQEEIEAVLSSETNHLVSAYYQISREGNWEDGKNILFCIEDDQRFAESRGLGLSEWQSILNEANEKLFEVRAGRIRPTTDNKILTSWNALILKGYVDAYCALGVEDYLHIALKNASFLEKNMLREGGRLWRNYMNGQAAIEGLLEDYALLADAYIALYRATFDQHWLALAHDLVSYVLRHFGESRSSLFYYTADHAEVLIARKKEIEDNVIPASNSVMARVLYQLGIYYDKEAYLKRAEAMLKEVVDQIPSAAGYFANWIQLMGCMQQGVYEVAIAGKEAWKKNRELQREYLPIAVFMGGEAESLPLLENKLVPGETFIYVCKNRVCKNPVKEVDQALQQINSQ